MTEKRTHANQFPDIAIPEEILALVRSGTLEDSSWRNDACASFGYIRTYRFADDLGGLRVWVDHEDPAQREMPGGNRFTVSAFGDGTEPILYRTNDVGRLGAFFSAFLRAEKEINADIAAGRVPATVASFADLHEHVDANEYGGLCEAVDPTSDDDCAFSNGIQTALDLWIRAGRPE